MTPNFTLINRALRKHGCDSREIRRAPSGMAREGYPYIEWDMAKGLPVTELTDDEVRSLARCLIP